MNSLTHSSSTNTNIMTVTSAPSSPAKSPSSSPYLDPYTTLPAGYQSRWKALLAKLQSSLNRRKSSDSADELHERDSRPILSLTERNLVQFFNPDYSDELDVFKDPKSRINPYDSPAKRERVGAWIRELPL